MMTERPNPDALLEAIDRPEDLGRGRLKIFFGAAPGVGKTYAMLEAAARELKSGVDIVIGYLEPHQRPDTTALAQGLPAIPPKYFEHRGVQLSEFDLDAALARKPKLIIVDELAHTNAPGSANNKRWQDIEHLLAAGIDVYTTLNVQHLETINDVVAQATGVAVRETVPDAVFEGAWEVELIDLPPDELIARLKSGKVYIAEQAQRASESFFKKGNLIALRDLALRQTADRLDRQLDKYRRIQTDGGSLAVYEKLLVCVGPSPLSAKLVRAAGRMAASLRCRWLAVHIDIIGRAGVSSNVRERVLKNLRLAEQLGAETAILPATEMVSDLLKFASDHNISKIIVGKPQNPRWKELIFGSFVYTLTRRCREIDVYVISGDPEKGPARPTTARIAKTFDYLGYGGSVAIVAGCTAVNWLLRRHVDPLNLVMVYLIGVVMASSRFRRGPSILTALLSVLVFDFLFVVPYWTFAVSDTEYLFTFACMLLTGLVISSLTYRLRSQSEILRERGQRTARLFQFSRTLAECKTRLELITTAAATLAEAAGTRAGVILAADDGRLGLDSPASQFPLTPQLHAVASWALEHDQPAGSGTSVLSASTATFYPLVINSQKLGVAGFEASETSMLPDPERLALIEALIDVLKNTLDRLNLTEQAEKARLDAEAERVRNILLSTVSHDLRTPLAAIEGAGTTLLENGETLKPEARRALLNTVVEEVDYLNRLVGNLLDATRIDGGTVILKKEWQSAEEMVGSVVHRLKRLLSDRPVIINLADHLPLFRADAILFNQVLINLLENSAKFSQSGSPIEIGGRQTSEGIEITISDRGSGIAEEDLPYLFDKFFRGRQSTERQGAGLGLAVCKGIIELHGGSIRAENRNSGGAKFIIIMPFESPPAAEAEPIAG